MKDLEAIGPNQVGRVALDSGQQSGVVQCLAVCDDAYLLHEPNTLRKQLNTLIAAQRDVTRRHMTRHHKE